MAARICDTVYEWNIALEELRHVTTDFTRPDIVHVEAHWRFYDLTSWSSGYVVGLKDGRAPTSTTCAISTMTRSASSS